MTPNVVVPRDVIEFNYFQLKFKVSVKYYSPFAIISTYVNSLQ